ncbi:hypothetical protein ACLOAV_000818 [Pseudogymnoascus australis]
MAIPSSTSFVRCCQKGIISSPSFGRRTQRSFLASLARPKDDLKLSSQARGNTFNLPSGRMLGYHSSGDPDGVPVLYFHGHPDSGIQVTGHLESTVARSLGTIRLTFNSSSSIWDCCGITFSGLAGTGFTLACAKNLPKDQLAGVGICAGVGPYETGWAGLSEANQKGLQAWKQYPNELEEYFTNEYVPLAQMADAGALRERVRSDFQSWFSGRDRESLLQEGALSMAVDVYRQVYAQGARAHRVGVEFNLRSWGFALEDIDYPRIKLWYGEKDVNTSPEMGRYMASKLPDSRYKEYKGESHFTIWRKEIIEEMLKELLDR